MFWQTLKVRMEDGICFVQFNRPEANNTINAQLIEDFHSVLDLYEGDAKIIVLEGSKEVFCFGADFQGIHAQMESNNYTPENPEALYNLWLRLAGGSYITLSHVRGKVNAGGVGFVAASDIVLADDTALFSLSEMLFGLFPAIVLPFLIRKIGFQKAHYLTLMTKGISVKEAQSCGLVDDYLEKSDVLLRQHLKRLMYLPKPGIVRYKKYMNSLNPFITLNKDMAISANLEAFSDKAVQEKIFRFIDKGLYPWEE